MTSASRLDEAPGLNVADPRQKARPGEHAEQRVQGMLAPNWASATRASVVGP